MFAIEAWREYTKTHDPELLRALLHPDAVFESPILHTPQQGAEVCLIYMSAAARVLGGPQFRWVNEWRNANGGVLEFENEIDGVRINAVDLITHNADGTLITHFKVMVRPLKAMNLVMRLMGEEIAKSQAPAKGSV